MSGQAALLLTLGLVAVGIVAELGLRWRFRREHYYVHPPGTRELLELDPEAHPQLEGKVRFAINPDGERGSPFVPGPGVRRLVDLHTHRWGRERYRTRLQLRYAAGLGRRDPGG